MLKSTFRKSLIGLSLGLSLLTNSIPCLAAEKVVECHSDKIYFDQHMQAYYLNATNINDKDDHFTIYLFDKSKEDKTITNQLNSVFQYKLINITYEDGDTPKDISDDIILSFELE